MLCAASLLYVIAAQKLAVYVELQNIAGKSGTLVLGVPVAGNLRGIFLV